MARVDDRKDFIILIAGFLFAAASYLAKREFDSFDAAALQVNRHFEFSDQRLNAHDVAIAILQTHKNN